MSFLFLTHLVRNWGCRSLWGGPPGTWCSDQSEGPRHEQMNPNHCSIDKWNEYNNELKSQMQHILLKQSNASLIITKVDA